MTEQIRASDLKGRLVFRDGKLILKKNKPRSAIQKPRMIINDELIKETFERYLSNGGIFIPYNSISSKNSMEFKYIRKRGGKGERTPALVHSNAYNHYVEVTDSYWGKHRDLFLEMIKNSENPTIKPVRVKFYFIRINNSRFDYANLMQGPADLMVKKGWIIDDNMKEFMPIPLGYEINPDCPGVVIYV